MAIFDPDVSGTLTIDGFLLNTPAYACVNLLPLLEGPEQRGEDVLVPGVAGVVPIIRRATVTEYELELVIDGSVQANGTDYPGTALAGWEAHLAAIRAAVSDPTGVGDGTRTAVYVTPSGDTLTGEVHVGKLRTGAQVDGRGVAVLPISIPAGALA